MTDNNSVLENLPEPTLTPDKDFDAVRHDQRILHLRGRPVFDWDLIHGREIIQEHVSNLTEEVLTDGTFGEGWKAFIEGNTVRINPGRVKTGRYIVELFRENDVDLNIDLIPRVEQENIVAVDGVNANKLDGTSITFQLNSKNLRASDGGVATPPSTESLTEFRSGRVDFAVQGTRSSIVQVDAVNGFVTFNSAPTLPEINEGIYVSYRYGRTGTKEIPAILYAEIEMIRVTEEEDDYLRDNIMKVSASWRDKFDIKFNLDIESGSWDKILINAMSHEGYGETYFVLPICTIIDGSIKSDDRPSALLDQGVAPFGAHGSLAELYEDQHPQYLTKERHEGIDHSKFFDGLNKLSGITIQGVSGFSDRTVNVDVIKPFVSNVLAVDNTHVDVFFSEQLDMSTALNPANYAILDITTGNMALSVFNVNPLSNTASVRLTTGNQQSKQYTMIVTNIKDTFGNPIDSNKNSKDFAGIA